ncbi:unnamed protein product [Cochlearia groenlandica]
METTTNTDHQQRLISSFMEIIVDQTIDTAKQFLLSTSWNLEEALNLFLIHRLNQNSSHHNSLLESQVKEDEEEQIRAPLPCTIDTLYDSSSMHATSSVQACPEEIWDSNQGQDSVGLDSKLSSLYRLPFNLLFRGSFEDAKTASSRKNLWLLVNLQSKTEFASHTLNRDLWSNDLVSQAIESSFVLWQVYDDTNDGKKISTFYRIESSPPVVLLIDPITGQKMRSWSGAVEPHGFVEDMMNYNDSGPHDHIDSLTSNKRIKTDKTCFESNHETTNQDMSTSEENISICPKKEETCLSSNPINQILAPSWGEEFEESCEEAMEEDICLYKFPDLTEEPKGDCDRSLVCTVCVRFPSGTRKQRKFFKTEPIQLLWSYCYSHMDGSDKKGFKLVQAVPGAYKTLDFEVNVSFEQSGIANSVISVTWE